MPAKGSHPAQRKLRNSTLFASLIVSLALLGCGTSGGSPTQPPPSPGNSPPTATITSPVNPSTITIFDLVTMTGTASDPEDGPSCCANNFRWLNNAGDLIGTGMSATQDSFVIGTQTIELEVKDLDGNAGKDLVTLMVNLGGELIYEADNPNVANSRWVESSDGLTRTPVLMSGEWPVYSHDGFRVAFVRGGEIWVSSALGEMQLTNNNADDLSPTWSPDGTRIAYSSNVSGDYEIYIMNSTTGALVSRVTNKPGLDVDPDWSGNVIAWEHQPNGGAKNIWRVADDLSTNAVQLTTTAADDRDPRWTFDGTRIVFSSTRDGNREIYIMDADGTNQTRLTNDSGEDKEGGLSPDGTRLAFVSDRGGAPQIWIAMVDGSTPVVYAGPVAPDHTRWKR